jgi:hypothetical protein
MESRLKPNPIHWWLYTITAAVMLAGLLVAPRFLPIDNRPDVVKRHALLEENCLGDPIEVPVPSRIYAITNQELLTLPDAQVHKRYGIVVSNELSHILCENDLNALLAKHKSLSVPNPAECKKEDSCMYQYQYQYDPRLLFADAGLMNMTTLPYSFQSPAFKKYLLQPNHSSPDSSSHKKTQTSRQEPFFMIPAGILVAPNLPFVPVSEILNETKKSCWNRTIPISAFNSSAGNDHDKAIVIANRAITTTVSYEYENTAAEKHMDFSGISPKVMLPVSDNCALLIPRRPNQGIVISTPDN